jgi:hypothetical protein
VGGATTGCKNGASARDSRDEMRKSIAAAWAFVNSSISPIMTGANSSTTGINFVDEALRQKSLRQRTEAGLGELRGLGTPRKRDWILPFVEIRGPRQSGKTWTVVTLAARFAVSTRLSLFGPASSAPVDCLSQVIIFDDSFNVTTSKLVYAVRSLLLHSGTDGSKDSENQPPPTGMDGSTLVSPPALLERDLDECLSRIHVARVDDLTEWVAILEMVRQNALPTDRGRGPPGLSSTILLSKPTLLLWDDCCLTSSRFYQRRHGLSTDDSVYQQASRTEILRQLERLVEQCPVMVVATTTAANSHVRRGRKQEADSSIGIGGNLQFSGWKEWEKWISHRIVLDESDHGGRVALISEGIAIPYSLSLAGVQS